MKTQKEKIRQETALAKIQVQNLLGWDDMTYAQFQQAMGLAYLDHHYGDAPLVSRIPEHKEFWSWWILHWMRRDKKFLFDSTALFSHEMESYYQELHDPKEMKHKPQGIILKNTYASTIHRLVKNSTSPSSKRGVIGKEVDRD